MKPLISCALCALFAFAVSAANATFVTNPDGSVTYTGPDDGPDGPGGMTGWAGSDVWYAGVTESNSEGAGGSTAQLFGAPVSVSGNAIDFNPQGFEASVSAPIGAPIVTEIVDSQLTFMVVALSGQVIDNLQFTEAGDTTLAGLPTSTLTFSSVTNEIFIDVLEVDGVPLSTIVNLQDDMTFTPSNGDYSLADDGNGVSPVFATDWSGFADIDIAAGLTAAGIDFQFGATKVNVTLDNTLTATATNGESSFIRKKDFDGLTVTSNIPEPATLALLALGLAPLACRRR